MKFGIYDWSSDPYAQEVLNKQIAQNSAKSTLENYTPPIEQQYAEMREDTAIQRQAQDMQAAGINPILMATNGWGGASSAASVSRIATTAAEKNANTKETKMILDFVKDLFNSAAKVLH